MRDGGCGAVCPVGVCGGEVDLLGGYAPMLVLNSTDSPTSMEWFCPGQRNCGYALTTLIGFWFGNACTRVKLSCFESEFPGVEQKKLSYQAVFCRVLTCAACLSSWVVSVVRH